MATIIFYWYFLTGIIRIYIIINVRSDIDKKTEKIDEITREINRIEKAMRRGRHKYQHHRELSLRLNELKNLKTENKNKTHALKQIISHIEEVEEQVKLKVKELKKKIENIPKENPFDFTEYVEKQKAENDIDIGFFLELAEENRMIYNQTPKNVLIWKKR